MSTEAQIAANQQNATLSTGPTTQQGKDAICFNAFRHGLAGRFVILPHEDKHEFQELYFSLKAEHRPSTPTEHLLVERMAEHWWLAQRALCLQQLCFEESETCQDPKQLALYLRYQTTHDRGFHKCLSELLRLRAQKRKVEIGFVSQKHKDADELRKQELHEARVRLANARASHLEIDSDIRQTIEAPLPGHVRIPFEDLCHAFKVVVNEVNGKYKAKLEEKAAA
ncbi:MAG: hypothetical protein JO138_05080 [Acidobacteriaceae bacterium]|nr:hypothetical protein [Acidobacteriaceae bacterium]